jgi:hypothetical protein
MGPEGELVFAPYEGVNFISCRLDVELGYSSFDW